MQTSEGVGIPQFRYPYLYKIGTPISIEKVEFRERPDSDPLESPIAIKGEGSDGAKFGPVNGNVSGQTVSAKNIIGSKDFSNTSKYAPDYVITWYYSTDDKPLNDPEKNLGFGGDYEPYTVCLSCRS